MEWDERIEQASVIISSRENYQRTLGKLSYDIAAEYGVDKLNDFSNDIKERHGLSVAPSTLRNYRWVWDKTNELDLPEDLSYRTLQYIASSGRAKYWAKRIEKEGLSSPEVMRLIRMDKGLDEKKKQMTICP